MAADIGCHAFATLPPFNMGNTILGYGMGLASASAVAPTFGKRVISILGDGGFWHSGLTAGVANAVYNKQDSVLVILENFYTSATGQQSNPSSGKNPRGDAVRMSIADTIKSLGVPWIKVVNPYKLGDTLKVVKEAMTTAAGGLKVIIARAECQLERQRRVKPQVAAQLKAGARVETPRFGVDPDVCTGDKSCMRFNGCPSLTLKDNPDPAARRPRGPRRPELRRLRALRRGRPCRRPLPVVLRDAGGQEPERVGARHRGAPLARDRPAAGRVMADAARPVSILIAALGGQGGGVLTEWIVAAAAHAGYPAQSTSIPGVAQRTGATTYYLEVFPDARRGRGRRRAHLLPLSDGGRRGRDHRLGDARGGPHARDGLCLARPHDGHRQHASPLRHRREERARQRGLPARAAGRSRARAGPTGSSPSTRSRSRGGQAARSTPSCSARSPRRAPCRCRRPTSRRRSARAVSRWIATWRGFRAGIEAGDAVAVTEARERRPPVGRGATGARGGAGRARAATSWR